MKHFIEVYDEDTGVMLAKVAGKTQPECNVRALELLKTCDGPARAVWFVGPKESVAKHVTAGRQEVDGPR